MKTAALRLVPAFTDVDQDAGDPIDLDARVGTIVALDDEGVPRIEFPGNPHGPLVARLAMSASDAERLARQWKDAEVLIVFAERDIRRPVIVGLIRNSLEDKLYQAAGWEGFPQLFLRAHDELILQCGEAKIILRRDGKVTIVGKEILSRAAERHRIRGGTIDIN